MRISDWSSDVCSSDLSLAAKGARFAVCGMATQGMAAQIAKTSGKPAKTIEDELKANMIPGAVIVPDGIVAVDRAQGHGYAFVHVENGRASCGETVGQYG